jgi:hypothetical protein
VLAPAAFAAPTVDRLVAVDEGADPARRCAPRRARPFAPVRSGSTAATVRAV